MRVVRLAIVVRRNTCVPDLADAVLCVKHDSTHVTACCQHQVSYLAAVSVLLYFTPTLRHVLRATPKQVALGMLALYTIELGVRTAPETMRVWLHQTHGRAICICVSTAVTPACGIPSWCVDVQRS
jgi:hypothetical protein